MCRRGVVHSNAYRAKNPTRNPISPRLMVSDRQMDEAPTARNLEAELGRVLITDSQTLTWMCRPTSVIGGKADMARTCQYVR